MKNLAPFIPLDKSWMIRMGLLDLIHGKDTTIQFLQSRPDSDSTDIQALLRASLDWKEGRPIRVGEAGTLYRFLLFSTWMLNEEREFVLEGTLRDREINLDPTIIHYSTEQLLTLDNGTSQWASAASMWKESVFIFEGTFDRIVNPPYKLQVTYDAIDHWKSCRQEGVHWVPRLDKTIETQAITFLDLYNDIPSGFIPLQPEDYCFARAFGFISPEEGRRRWPSLVGHESNRILEMEKALAELLSNRLISSCDHRVVQAIAMKAKVDCLEHTLHLDYLRYFRHQECITKSWPRFWDFIKAQPLHF